MNCDKQLSDLATAQLISAGVAFLIILVFFAIAYHRAGRRLRDARRR